MTETWMHEDGGMAKPQPQRIQLTQTETSTVETTNALDLKSA